MFGAALAALPCEFAMASASRSNPCWNAWRVRALRSAVLDQVVSTERTVAACVQQIANSRTRPPHDTEDVFGQLELHGLVESIAALRARDGGPLDERVRPVIVGVPLLSRAASPRSDQKIRRSITGVLAHTHPQRPS